MRFENNWNISTYPGGIFNCGETLSFREILSLSQVE